MRSDPRRRRVTALGAVASVAIAFGGCTQTTDPETPIGPVGSDDALAHLGRSQSPSFFEPTDLVVVGDYVYVCTGVRGLSVHDAHDPTGMREIASITVSSKAQYERCSHIARRGDRVVAVAPLDDIQPVPTMALLDVSTPGKPTVLARYETDISLDQAAIVGDRVFVAAHEAGVVTYSIASDDFVPGPTLDQLGNVLRVAPVGDGIAAGTADGQLIVLDADLNQQQTVDVGTGIQAILDIGADRALVALGSKGLSIVDLTTGMATKPVATRGTALRLSKMADDRVAVANWRDIRVYKVSGDVPELLAVDAVFQADTSPRHLGAAASDDLIFAGEWTGIHALRFRSGKTAAEFTPSVRRVAMPDDGAAFTTQIDLHNEGNASLTVDDTATPTGWSATPTTFAIAPGARQSITLTHPGSNTPTSGLLRFTTNDPDEPTASLELRVGSDRVFVGDPAPDFSYDSANTGDTVTLSALKGKVVVLSYFGYF